MDSFFNFDEMITPKIITVVYYLLIVGVVIGGLVSMLGGIFAGDGNFFVRLIISPIVSVFGVAVGILGVRIYCEILIVLFKIHENLRNIAERKTAPSSPDSV